MVKMLGVLKRELTPYPGSYLFAFVACCFCLSGRRPACQPDQAIVMTMPSVCADETHCPSVFDKVCKSGRKADRSVAAVFVCARPYIRLQRGELHVRFRPGPELVSFVFFGLQSRALHAFAEAISFDFGRSLPATVSLRSVANPYVSGS